MFRLPRPSFAADLGSAPGAAANGPQLIDVPPDILIIVPLRNFVLFPGVVMPVTITQPAAVAAAQQAVRQGRQIGLLKQRDPSEAEPSPLNLHRMGVICNILRFITAPDGS